MQVNLLPAFFIDRREEQAMSEWIKAAPISAFEKNKGVVVIEHDDVRIAIFKLENGFYAIEDECSHAEAYLSEGRVVNGCEIECPLHGARFDLRDGTNLSFPAVTPVTAFPTRVEDGNVFVRFDE